MPSDNAWLNDLTVVEIGSRVAVGGCGNLLTQAGATVIFVEPPDQRDNNKWRHRALFAAGKRSLCIDPANGDDPEILIDLIKSCDVVLISSDVDPSYAARLEDAWAADTIVCDITAFGHTGPMAGKAYSEAMLEAITGAAHTTGPADGPPVIAGVPVIEYAAAVYGAAATVAAIKSRSDSGKSQHIDLALFDCAVNCLGTFLPSHFGGGSPARVGNQHTMCAPWNAYRATDSWILICSASQSSWHSICKVMEIEYLKTDPMFETLAARVDHRDEIDAIIQEWVGQRDLAACMEILLEAGVACGPILKLDVNGEDVNLAHRAMVSEVRDPISEQTVRIPGAVIKPTPIAAEAMAHIPEPDADRAYVRSLANTGSGSSEHNTPGQPLAGIRVLEIGQYTTAPLACRHLATLGAEVLKIEPPEGDAARHWQPSNEGHSYFFVMTNSDKQSYALDLNDPTEAEDFTKLVASADILIENLKPGSLARRGFSRENLNQINPRLIYCAISGFGTDSAYGQRPAFDTVVQAMSGFMDANIHDGMPMKAGISVGDLMGGEVGLFAVLAALHGRRQSGLGAYVDLSMQDVAAWVTAPAWNNDIEDASTMVACADGYVLVDQADDLDRSDLSRTELVDKYTGEGIPAAPVLDIAEVAGHPQATARELIAWRKSETGTDWPLLGSPLGLSGTPPVVSKPIGQARRMSASEKLALGLD